MSYVDKDIVVIGIVDFHDSLEDIRMQLQSLRRDIFYPKERIIIIQRKEDQYPYIDSPGSRLIELQQIVNQVDIGNCFILILTHNPDIENEIAEVHRLYSYDETYIDNCLYPGVYNKQIPKYDNVGCKKLWAHLFVGTDANVQHCCVSDHRRPYGNLNDASVKQILDNDTAKKSRQWMLDGYRQSACAICYEAEDKGRISPRSNFQPKSLERLPINTLDIRLNNICNFKCRMCSEYFSSSLQQETIEMYGKDAILGYEKVNLKNDTHKIRQTNLDKILPYVTRDIKHIYFAGGEPLITYEHYVILQRLIDIKHFDVDIRYNTNLSHLTFRKKSIFEFWKFFTNIEVCASLDASNKVAEYMRHGTVWDETLANISQIQSQAPNIALEIDSVVSWPTVENIIALQTKWIDDGLFTADQFDTKPLVNPEYLSLTTLPKHHKQRIQPIIEQHIKNLGSTRLAKQWSDILKHMYHNNTKSSISEFTRRTSALDKHRNESFTNIFPQFTDLFQVAKSQ